MEQQERPVRGRAFVDKVEQVLIGIYSQRTDPPPRPRSAVCRRTDCAAVVSSKRVMARETRQPGESCQCDPHRLTPITFSRYRLPRMATSSNTAVASVPGAWLVTGRPTNSSWFIGIVTCPRKFHDSPSSDHELVNSSPKRRSMIHTGALPGAPVLTLAPPETDRDCIARP